MIFESAARRCPRCDKMTRYRSPTWYKHAFRVIMGDRSRYCKDCHVKWRTSASHNREIKVVFASVALVGVVLFVLSLFSTWDPVRWVKELTVSGYKETHNSDAKTSIHKDWSWLYSSDSSAEGDFNKHE